MADEALFSGLTAANVSEFGFILVFKGQELGYCMAMSWVF